MSPSSEPSSFGAPGADRGSNVTPSPPSASFSRSRDLTRSGTQGVNLGDFSPVTARGFERVCARSSGHDPLARWRRELHAASRFLVRVGSLSLRRGLLRGLYAVRVACASAAATVIESISPVTGLGSRTPSTPRTRRSRREQSHLAIALLVESGLICSDDTSLRHPCCSPGYDPSLSKRWTAA
jgi:hypothetical protein